MSSFHQELITYLNILCVHRARNLGGRIRNSITTCGRLLHSNSLFRELARNKADSLSEMIVLKEPKSSAFLPPINYERGVYH